MLIRSLFHIEKLWMFILMKTHEELQMCCDFASGCDNTLFMCWRQNKEQRNRVLKPWRAEEKRRHREAKGKKALGRSSTEASAVDEVFMTPRQFSADTQNSVPPCFPWKFHERVIYMPQQKQLHSSCWSGWDSSTSSSGSPKTHMKRRAQLLLPIQSDSAVFITMNVFFLLQRLSINTNPELEAWMFVHNQEAPKEQTLNTCLNAEHFYVQRILIYTKNAKLLSAEGRQYEKILLNPLSNG